MKFMNIIRMKIYHEILLFVLLGNYLFLFLSQGTAILVMWLATNLGFCLEEDC